MYFDKIIDELSSFNSATYVTNNNYYLFDRMNNEDVKEKRMYSEISSNRTK